MKRDMDLARSILSVVEEKSPPIGGIAAPAIDGYDSDTVIAHIELLSEAGLLRAKVMKGIAGHSGAHITGLTWAGHDFISAAKDDTIWAKAKGSILKQGSSITFDLLLEWLKAEARKHLPF